MCFAQQKNELCCFSTEARNTHVRLRHMHHIRSTDAIEKGSAWVLHNKHAAHMQLEKNLYVNQPAVQIHLQFQLCCVFMLVCDAFALLSLYDALQQKLNSVHYFNASPQRRRRHTHASQTQLSCNLYKRTVVISEHTYCRPPQNNEHKTF